MSDPQQPRRYDVPIDDLEKDARVDADDRVEEVDANPAPDLPRADPMFGYGIHAG